MVVSFACGLLLAIGPAIILARALVNTDGDVGAGEWAGADSSQSTQPPVTAAPGIGTDPDANATADPWSGEVPGINGNGDGAAPGVPTSGSVTCPKATTTVTDAETLTAALGSASAGDVIALADGTYDGEFVATTSGTSDRPIYLCGTSKSVLQGEGHSAGYVFHLDGAKNWRLVGFTVRNGQKGVMADGTEGTIIQGLTIHSIGDEALHLRKFSTHNTVIGNTIYDTGNRREKFGEGVYIGTAESNWCDISDCKPDRSDNNLVEGNVIYGVTAEAVDIKEGTSNGVVRANTFDGSALVENGADSWVDVKGNEWLIEGNIGQNTVMDGFQVHEILDGWGIGNRFRSNTATVNGPGFGFSLTPVRDNVVECSNVVSDAREGYANVSCS
nr:right-handed parallel beta-helix repeat-containing protein [Demequina sp. TTPB684]